MTIEFTSATTYSINGAGSFTYTDGGNIDVNGWRVQITGNPAAVSLAGVQLAQFAIGVLGVLLMTGEYATGSIRVSLAAVPRAKSPAWYFA